MLRPPILEDAGFDIYLDTRKLKDLPLPIEIKNIDEFTWCFNYPVWEKDGTDDWNLTPQDVINQKEGSSDHKIRIENADLAYPIVAIVNKNRWVILDGVHRLVKAYLQGQKCVKVKVLTKDNQYFKDAQIRYKFDGLF